MDGGLSVTCYERYEHICGLGMTGRKDERCEHVREGRDDILFFLYKCLNNYTLICVRFLFVVLQS